VAVKSGVIMLVGTAQAGPVNTITMCTSDVDDAKFLPPTGTAELAGFTIPQALRAIRQQLANALVLVVNVWDVSWTDATAATRIIGTTSAAGIRSGLQLVADVYNLFGFTPKLLIAPGFSSSSSVAVALIAKAEQVQAYALIDAPLGTSVTQAIAGRGPGGTINFQTSSSRAILCYPHVKMFDPVANGIINQPLSQVLAGAMAFKDTNFGVGYSVSNTNLQGVVGLERNLTASMNDPNCEVNLLNAQGITTVFNSRAGFRSWGNRAANFPTTNGLATFVCCGRQQDVMDEAIRYFSFDHLDKPVSGALITHIVDKVNAFINEKVMSGEYLGGEAWYDQAKNTPEKLGDGWARVSYRFTPAPPLERLTFDSEITNDYLILKIK
jgi:phage tail sheath protein FI